MTGPLQHVFIIACYYKDQAFITGQKVNLADQCSTANGFYWTFAFLPYWWRFGQCLNKWHNEDKKIHLVNAGKYFSCLVSPAVLIFLTSSSASQGLKYDQDYLYWLYFACHLVQTTYCFLWDIIMDWGLLSFLRKQDKKKAGKNEVEAVDQDPQGKNRANKIHNRWLREKINYAPCFYYWAIVSDFVLRYIYILFLYKLGQPDSFFNQIDTMFAISTFAEGFRRAQWALLRVENEQNNNLEAYRTIPIIPPIISSEQQSKNGSSA